MMLTTAILSGFAAALVAPLVWRAFKDAAGWVLALLPLGLTIYYASQIGAVADGQAISEHLEWAGQLGVRLSLRLDGLGLLFSLLISGIGTLIVVYGGGYLKGDRNLGRFYLLILMFMASMLGIVAADNLLALYVFWELTTISSFLLIGYNHDEPDARASAWQALLVTSIGGLAMLGGFFLLASAGGSFEISTLMTRGDSIRAHDHYLPILLLILAGAFTKSAQFPFHFWLPNAMAAPTPVSAYLHSATMVKAGIFLLARLSPALAGTGAWITIVTIAGAATMLVGGLLALLQTDLKRILAYSTVSALGLITMLLGQGTQTAVIGAMVFLVAHAMYKGALFMVAGIIDHETGTRDVTDLGGLRRLMPRTAVIATLAGLAMTGIMPFFAFIGKELAIEALLHGPQHAALLVAALFMGAAIFVAIAGVVVVRPFFGRLRTGFDGVHEPPMSLWLGPGLLALLGLVTGLASTLVGTWLIAPAVTSILGHPRPISLSLWHGFTLPLGISVTSFLAGGVIYLLWPALGRLRQGLRPLLRLGPAAWYEWTVAAITAVASGQTRVLQNGYLPYYVAVTMISAVGLIAYTFWRFRDAPLVLNWTDIRFYEALLGSLILAAAVVTVRSRSRLFAIAGLGVVGYGVALFFVLYGAPDLAMTQFCIETLSVILFVLVFYHLPRFSLLSNRAARSRDLLVSLGAGAVVTALVLVANSVPPDMGLVDYYARHSFTEGHGRNIVNVILVDFRGIDTMGEITVLAIAGIGIFALLKLRLGKRGDQ